MGDMYVCCCCNERVDELDMTSVPLGKRSLIFCPECYEQYMLKQMGPKREVVRSFHVGGDPEKIAFLSEDLDKKLESLQRNGWTIMSVDLINNTRAWDADRQAYVTTQEYIITARTIESDNETDDETEEDYE